MEYKRLNDIDTLQATTTNELYIGGKDEQGNDFTIVFDSFDFLRWINSEGIEYIKDQTIAHINNL